MRAESRQGGGKKNQLSGSLTIASVLVLPPRNRVCVANQTVASLNRIQQPSSDRNRRRLLLLLCLKVQDK